MPRSALLQPDHLLETSSPQLAVLQEQIVTCTRCSRLRAYGEAIGERRRRAYMDQTYWAKPVPGFGDPQARVLILGLAPGAHGANRTGRPFTGDGSGDFMFPILHRVGFASQATATSADDGLSLRDAWIGSIVRCAPPGDKPTPEEQRNCRMHLAAELTALGQLQVVVCLGRLAWDNYLAYLLARGQITRRADFAFSHGAEYKIAGLPILLGCYHPSLRNTNTGRLDADMFATVFVKARQLAGLGRGPKRHPVEKL